MPNGGALARERGHREERWRCLAATVSISWPSTPSPWECRCGAVWTLEGAEEFEDAPPPVVGELELPPLVDTLALLLQITSLTDSELETLARAVGEEQSRRSGQAVETEHPPPLPKEEAETGPPQEPAGGAEPMAPTRVVPAARATPRPTLVYIAPCGRVWHADSKCKHLYYRGQRRAQVRAVALTELRKGSDFPPCRDCSAAWLGATSSPRTLRPQATPK